MFSSASVAVPLALVGLLNPTLAVPLDNSGEMTVNAAKSSFFGDPDQWCADSGSGIKSWDKAKDVYKRTELPGLVESCLQFYNGGRKYSPT